MPLTGQLIRVVTGKHWGGDGGAGSAKEYGDVNRTLVTVYVGTLTTGLSAPTIYLFYFTHLNTLNHKHYSAS